MTAPQPARLQGLPPIASPAMRLLVLGSFPGARSLALGQYYAHPQNHFWRILGELWRVDMAALDYAGRTALLRARGLGLWDVYASCERAGSLDTAIRNAQVNDFAALARTCVQLQAIAHNGGESHRHARHSRALGLPVYRLPSTSPANATWSFARKRDAWADVLGTHGLM
ncbi:DNA-deoxyinosine glycosylase [Ramlibacter sp. H39-3-26]|uniref:DNA-deoxyinosine glycosylase n=1 Tax=Curvibacter soli TaxID=3031331 RepID=UPI0023DCBFF0|nr:DNA-deoxyinosine glycosylase [Ramlibacter sp. H39-3-26]MDF1483624.1 DNA-deoxyinosine glycosylase [Ramlibacter sp. H39-3-26]